jgi:hypothetical protein
MRILVCGGRDFDDWTLLNVTLSEFQTQFNKQPGYNPTNTVIIEGGAIGADFLARCWAKSWGLNFEEYKADWKKHGNAAGPIRNQQMLDTGIDLVIAFPGGVGTADMIRRAKKAGVKVIEISEAYMSTGGTN